MKSRSAEMMKESGISNEHITDIDPKLPFGDRTARLLSEIENGNVIFTKFKHAAMGSKDATLKSMREVMDNLETSRSFPLQVKNSEAWIAGRNFVNSEEVLDNDGWNHFEMSNLFDGDLVWSLVAYIKRAEDRLDFFFGYVVMGGIMMNEKEIQPSNDLLAAVLIRKRGIGYDSTNECYRYLST